eukprot:SAG22_NODE_2643_length_2341_cov_6.214541_1_plen_389_part_00
MAAGTQAASRARALLAEAERLEHEGESMQAMAKYRQAFKLDSDLEAETFREAEEGAAGPEVEVRTGEVPHFGVDDPRWLAHLESEGFAVVSGCCRPEELAAAKDSLWEFLEDCPACVKDGTKLSRTNPDSWGTDAWPADAVNGMFSRYGFPQSEFCWRARLNPLVQRAFAALWGVQAAELITSFDSGNVFRPWYEAGRPEWKTQGGWWHVDQNAAEPICHAGKCSVQGVLTYTDATAATGGLVVLPRTHHEHDAMCARHPTAYGDYLQLKPTDELLSGTRQAQLVTAPAGSLLLWDSRLVHCNTPALVTPPADGRGAATPLELLRVASYVCMVPRGFATAETLRNRVDAWEAREGTNHWPQYVAPTRAEKSRSIADAPAEVQRLVGTV